LREQPNRARQLRRLGGRREGDGATNTFILLSILQLSDSPGNVGPLAVAPSPMHPPNVDSLTFPPFEGMRWQRQ
jgi:hypothetical protein